MRTEKVSLWNVVIFAGSTISLLVGAGFATGQEVLQYFTGYGLNGFLTAALTLVVIAYAAAASPSPVMPRNLKIPTIFFAVTADAI